VSYPLQYSVISVYLLFLSLSVSVLTSNSVYLASASFLSILCPNKIAFILPCAYPLQSLLPLFNLPSFYLLQLPSYNLYSVYLPGADPSPHQAATAGRNPLNRVKHPSSPH
jgi:hypothetical protein